MISQHMHKLKGTELILGKRLGIAIDDMHDFSNLYLKTMCSRKDQRREVSLSRVLHIYDTIMKVYSLDLEICIVILLLNISFK